MSPLSPPRPAASRPSPRAPRALLLAALALLPVLAGSAQADPRWARYDREQREPRRDYPPQDRSGQRPMREAIGEVEQNYRGHVVDVQSLRRGDADANVYRMRVLQRDGRVKTVTVPANDEQRRH